MRVVICGCTTLINLLIIDCLNFSDTTTFPGLFLDYTRSKLMRYHFMAQFTCLLQNELQIKILVEYE